MTLRCETQTTEVEEAVLAAFDAAEGSVHTDHTGAVFEHRQWWINCGACGAQWSVNDASGHGSVGGFSFERVTDGDGYCEEGAE